MNELRAVLQTCLLAQVEPGGDPGLDELLDQRIEQIETRLIEMGEAREQMLNCIEKAARR